MVECSQNATPGVTSSAHSYLLQFVGLGLVFVPVGVPPVGEAEGPHREDAVNIVSDPSVWLITAAWQKTCYWILEGTRRGFDVINILVF